MTIVDWDSGVFILHRRTLSNPEEWSPINSRRSQILRLGGPEWMSSIMGGGLGISRRGLQQ